MTWHLGSAGVLNQTRTGPGLRLSTLGAQTVREVDADVHTMTSLNEEKSTSLHLPDSKCTGYDIVTYLILLTHNQNRPGTS